MNPRITAAALFVLVVSACNEPAPPAETPPGFNVDKTRITVSGVSAGAYMAGQFHVAHSSEVSGAGLIAGGPYWCASGSMKKGLGPCMNGGDVSLPALLDYARAQADLGSIGKLENLNGDRVWIFHGANDAVVHPDVPAASIALYEQLANNVEITYVTDVASPHGMPTIASDGLCEEMATPFLNNCDYDAAGELLKAVTTITNDRVVQPDGELIAVAQVGASDAEMLEEALLYVPAACAAGELCGLHVAFHGCQQSTEFVEDAYAANAGYNEWASNNNLLVLYPQVARSRVAPLNPLGCWDWWGYTGDDYATRSGAQIAVVKALVNSLSGSAN